MGNVSVFEVLWEWMREIEGKEEDLIIKIVHGSRAFFSDMLKMIGFSLFSRDWKR